MKKSLTLLLNENRLALEGDLAQVDDTRKAVAEANKYIDRIQADYTDELTVHQLAVAASMLQVVRNTLSSLVATYAEVWEKPAKLSPRAGRQVAGFLVAKATQVLIAAALIMALIWSQSWTGVVLAALLVGSETLVQIRTFQPGAWFPTPLGRRRAKARSPRAMTARRPRNGAEWCESSLGSF